MGTSGHLGCPGSQCCFMTCVQTMENLQQCAAQLGDLQFLAARYSARIDAWGPFWLLHIEELCCCACLRSDIGSCSQMSIAGQF